MRGLAIGAAMLALSGSACAQDRTGLPEWMVGAWCTAPGNERTCDRWTKTGDRLAGTSRATKDGKVVESEEMRIAVVNGRLTFYASVNGAPEVPFAVAAQTPQAVTFENAAHDYPQRIRFWRDGRHLKAEISLNDGSQAMSWTYEPSN